MANFNTEKTQAFINQASQIFERHGYRIIFRHPTVMVVSDKDYAKLGEIHTVFDLSEVPEEIDHDVIGYSDTGQFFWYLDEELENAILELENKDANELIRALIDAADGPLKLEGSQLELQLS